MLITDNIQNAPVGVTFCGRVFEPASTDEVCLVASLKNCSVCVSYLMPGMHWLLLPSIRVPRRFVAAIDDLLFDSDEEFACRIQVDRDGEVIVNVNRPWIPAAQAEIFKELEEALELIDSALVPALTVFLAKKLEEETSSAASGAGAGAGSGATPGAGAGAAAPGAGAVPGAGAAPGEAPREAPRAGGSRISSNFRAIDDAFCDFACAGGVINEEDGEGDFDDADEPDDIDKLIDVFFSPIRFFNRKRNDTE